MMQFILLVVILTTVSVIQSVVSTTDINECTSKTHGCSTNAVCTNTVGAYTCSCKPGFCGNGFICSDIDECTGEKASCSTNADCSNTVGSYTCSCKPGFCGNGFNCRDIDECTGEASKCNTNADCKNTVGSYKCSCKPGFTGDGFTCKERTSEATGCSTCADCTNVVGSYTRFCYPGFSGNGFTCTDVNECTGKVHKCSSKADCTNTVGSYKCSCKTGFSGNGFTCTGCEAPLKIDGVEYGDPPKPPKTIIDVPCSLPKTYVSDNNVIYVPLTKKYVCAPNSAWTLLKDNCNQIIKFTVHTDSSNFDAARSKCKANEGDLAILNTSQKNTAVANALSGEGSNQFYSYWIGMDDKVSEGTFKWIDGSSPVYTNWDTRQPDNYLDSDCVGVWKTTLKWQDYLCAASTYYICEKLIDKA